MNWLNKGNLKFMKDAVDLSLEGMRGNFGGPFGAVIVKNGEIIGRGFNRVISDNDPTAHAEIVAIRDACKNLNSHQLSGCEIYTSCEPCPMCLGAIYWARPDVIYYGNTRESASAIGFDDSMIYDEVSKNIKERLIPSIQLGSDLAIGGFREWKEKTDKSSY